MLLFSLKDFATWLNEQFLAHKYTQTVILVDENTKKHCLPILLKYLSEYSPKDASNDSKQPVFPIIEIKSGEKNKTLKTCEKIWKQLTDLNLDRKALLINLGGGVLGDMGGFCAATYKRGIDFIQIPTTLLAQVDASIGGKLGIDFGNFKNQIGVFCEPKAVFIDVEFLKTLPQRQIQSGFAEIIKHCLIADKAMFKELSKQKINTISPKNATQYFLKIISHSVSIKKKIVSEDFKEQGIRQILNFGHTIGHAIESYFFITQPKINFLLHGEAVAAGMLLESHISWKLGKISEKDFEEIAVFLKENYSKIKFSDDAYPIILENMAQDKKNTSKNINCVLLEGIGKASFRNIITENMIIEALDYYTK